MSTRIVVRKASNCLEVRGKKRRKEGGRKGRKKKRRERNRGEKETMEEEDGGGRKIGERGNKKPKARCVHI